MIYSRFARSRSCESGRAGAPLRSRSLDCAGDRSSNEDEEDLSGGEGGGGAANGAAASHGGRAGGGEAHMHGDR